MYDVWTILGIDPTDDVRAIKKAYARRLKENRPADDPEGFQALRKAYEIARESAENAAPAYESVSHHAFVGESLALRPGATLAPLTFDERSRNGQFEGDFDFGSQPEHHAENEVEAFDSSYADESRLDEIDDDEVLGEREPELDEIDDREALVERELELDEVDREVAFEREPELDDPEEVDLDQWVESVVTASNGVEKFREAITSDELLPIVVARQFELVVAARFRWGSMSPYDRLPLFAEIANYYRWDDPRHHVLHYFPELEEPAIVAVGAHRCRELIYGIASGEIEASRAERKAAQCLVGAHSVTFGRPKAILEWLPTLRGKFGKGWYWLLPVDLTELVIRSEKLEELREKKEDDSIPALVWFFGLVTGTAGFLLLIIVFRYIYYFSKVGWLHRKPSPATVIV